MGISFWHSVGNRFLTLLSNMFTDLNLTNMWTCYKAFRREVLEQIVIRENRFGIEPEITAKVARGKWPIFEVPISYDGRTYAQGKKIIMKLQASGRSFVLYAITFLTAVLDPPMPFTTNSEHLKSCCACYFSSPALGQSVGARGRSGLLRVRVRAFDPAQSGFPERLGAGESVVSDGQAG